MSHTHIRNKRKKSTAHLDNKSIIITRSFPLLISVRNPRNEKT